MKPSIGSIVHYIRNGHHYPACIVDAPKADGASLCALFVMYESGYTTYANEGVGDGTWHWPERVD